MKNILLALLFVGFLVGCKDDDDPIDETTAVTYLTANSEKGWKISSATAFGDNGAEIDVVRTQPCVSDYVWTLRNDLSYSMISSGQLCLGVNNVNSSYTYSHSPQQIVFAKISVVGQEISNAKLEITELGSSTFAGTINNIPENDYNVTRATLKFEAVK